jgi:citrate lyase subunit beta/citryl-CoA lyase
MRSLLFVPATGRQKLAKALHCGADAIIVDLEDSIARDRKAEARSNAAAFLSQAHEIPGRPRLFVRINGLATGLVDADLDAVVPGHPDAIVLPKAEGGVAITHADAKLCAQEAQAGLKEGHIKILAMAVETAASVFLAGTFRSASHRLAGLTWSAEDLSVQLSAEQNRDDHGQLTEPYRLARTLCLFAAAAANVPAFETIYPDFRDASGLKLDSVLARRDGFSGRMAIHPNQVPIINDVFITPVEVITLAKAIVAAFEAEPSAGIVGINGVIYERRHLIRARAVLERDQARRSNREGQEFVDD